MTTTKTKLKEKNNKLCKEFVGFALILAGYDRDRCAEVDEHSCLGLGDWLVMYIKFYLYFFFLVVFFSIVA